MRIAFALLCLLFFSSLAGQSILKEKITGEWVCQEVTFTKDETLRNTKNAESALKMTREAYTNASFIFGADGLFHLKTPVNVKNAWTEELSFLNGKPWLLDPKTHMINIGGKENLMGIGIREENGVVSFLLYETPIVLKMKRK